MVAAGGIVARVLDYVFIALQGLLAGCSCLKRPFSVTVDDRTLGQVEPPETVPWCSVEHSIGPVDGGEPLRIAHAVPSRYRSGVGGRRLDPGPDARCLSRSGRCSCRTSASSGGF